MILSLLQRIFARMGFFDETPCAPGYIPKPRCRPIVAYLAGPMSGIQDLNFPAFHAAAAKLRAQGFEVVNPAELVPDKNTTWEEAMRRDIAALVTCDVIALLPGWQDSRGASLEYQIASKLGMDEIQLEAQ